MPFPATFANAVHDGPRALAMSVMSELRAGRLAHPELIERVADASLSRDEAVGLAAALVQTRMPAAIVAGCYMATHLADPSMAELLLLALDGLDMGTLLQQASGEQSIEDVLLGALAACVHEPGPTLNATLTRLRHAGLVREELLLLLRVAQPDLLRQALPAIVLEGLPAGTADAIATAMTTSAQVAQSLAEGLTGVPAGDRTALWAAMVRHNVQSQAPEAVATLFPSTPSVTS